MTAEGVVDNSLCFIYTLRNGETVPGYAPGDIIRIYVSCFPDGEGGFSVEYQLFSEEYGYLPYSGFELAELPCSEWIGIDILEMVLRCGIGVRLEDAQPGMPENSVCTVGFTFPVNPVYAGRNGVDVRVDYIFPDDRDGWISLELSLYAGGTNLGIIGRKERRYMRLIFGELREYAEAVAEGYFTMDLADIVGNRLLKVLEEEVKDCEYDEDDFGEERD